MRLVRTLVAVIAAASLFGISRAVAGTEDPQPSKVLRVLDARSERWNTFCRRGECVLIGFGFPQIRTPRDWAHVDVSATVTLEYRTTESDPAYVRMRLLSQPGQPAMNPGVFGVAPSSRTSTWRCSAPIAAGTEAGRSAGKG
jgi:hypothetical protein